MLSEKINIQINKKKYLERHKGKVVMVSGASSGIGKALTLELLHKGYNVSLAARREDLIRAYLREEFLEEEILMHTWVLKTDVSVEEDCKNWVEGTYAHYGRIDILINNAGISMRCLFDECSLSVLKEVMAVNFLGVLYCTHYAIPYLVQAKGSLVGVSSIAAYQPLPGRTAYSASKAAMQGLLQDIRIENCKKGLHVMIVCPGFTSSNIRKNALTKDGNPQGETPRDESKMMTAEKVAKHILWAIDHRKRSLNLTPLGRLAVIASKILPRFTEKITYQYMAKEPNSPFK